MRPAPGIVNGIRLLDHMGLVGLTASRYRWALGGALELEDLTQAGYFGLVRAAEKFRPELGFSFTTYAMSWIRAFIGRAIANQRRLVRVPVWVQTEAVKTDAPRPAFDPLSLDAPPPGFDSDSSPWVERMDGSHEEPDDGAEQARGRKLVAAALQGLSPRTRDILHRRFWREETLEQIGKSHGITRERVRQIEREGMRVLERRLARVGRERTEA